LRKPDAGGQVKRGRPTKDGGTVPGAIDNLAASAAAVAMSRYLVRNSSNIPLNTEVRFVSFGSEEARLRGSRRYVEQHLHELKEWMHRCSI
jgi:Zn-dependent M28 family amino/carboxypeptidase